MKPEQLLWQLVKPYIPGHRERIENAVGVGMPDVHWTYNGQSNWMELKVAKTPEQTVEELLEPSQRVWHKKNLSEDGRVYVLVRYGPKITLFKAMRSMEGVHYVSIFAQTKPWSWLHFEEIIKNL